MDTGAIALASGLVLGISQVVKMTFVTSRWIPLVALVIGILLSWIIPNLDVVGGIIAGLSASGLYTGVKTTVSKTV